MKRALLILAAGVALGLGAVGLGGLSVIAFGLFDATATTPHTPLDALVTHAAMIRSIQVRARHMPPPPPITAARVTAGFHDYDAKCALCHGGPGVARQPWVSGMTPTPPFLLDAARQWRPRELNLIIGDGVKMTAMPGWRTTLSDDDIWNLTDFVEAMPYLKPRDYANMRARAAIRPKSQG